jgi:serine/threonine-protein kinase
MPDAVTRSASVPASASSTPRAEDSTPRHLGRYELLSCIARGGMATVWSATLAADHGFRRRVAIKLIRPELATDPAFRRMFLDEARLVSRLRHGNIVEISDLGEENAVVFHVMELVEGDSLGGLIRRCAERGGKKLPVEIVLRILTDILRGLHAAHELTDEHGVRLDLVHRDVSPQNILVGSDGVAKIADFGIAKTLGRLSEETEAGAFKGKLAYAAPEQVTRRAIDRRTDVFAAGVVLWEALTGVRLFKADDVLETLERLKAMKIDDPRTHDPALPSMVASVTMRALAPAMEDRFQTAEALADALEEAARGLPRAATTKDVAALVVELVPTTAPSSSRAVEDAATKTEATVGETVSSFPIPPRRPETTSARSSAKVGAAIAAVVVAVASIATVRSMQQRNAAPTPSPSTELPSLAVAPSISVPAPASAALPAPSSPASTPAASTAHRTTPRRAAPSSAPALRFGNPYGK